LEFFALIALGWIVVAQAQVHVQRVCHGLNTGGIDGIHLLDQPEYPGEAISIAPGLLLIDPQSRKMRYLFYFAIIDSHNY
jgi:hypothetical protein